VGWDLCHQVLRPLLAYWTPQMIDEGDCGGIGGMKIGRGNRSTRRKPSPAPLCPPQIPHDQSRARTRAAAVGSQRLTAWAMARLSLPYWLCMEPEVGLCSRYLFCCDIESLRFSHDIEQVICKHVRYRIVLFSRLQWSIHMWEPPTLNKALANYRLGIICC
jgi:hypothetical protein